MVSSTIHSFMQLIKQFEAKKKKNKKFIIRIWFFPRSQSHSFLIRFDVYFSFTRSFVHITSAIQTLRTTWFLSQLHGAPGVDNLTKWKHTWFIWSVCNMWRHQCGSTSSSSDGNDMPNFAKLLFKIVTFMWWQK